jgi:hypothetical protein
MSNWLVVESDVGDVLRVLLDDGISTGKHILNFLDGLATYCIQKKDEEDVQEWFFKLQTKTKIPICQLDETLTQSFCIGEFNYQEDEYDLYLHRSPAMDLTEDQFKKTVQQATEAFTDIESLLRVTNEFIRLLTETELKSTWWYVPEATENDFHALAQTLSFVAKRGAKEARIKIF